MKLIVFDTKGRHKETLTGVYDKGVFKYYVGSILKKEKTLPIVIDYDKLYDIGEKEKVAFAIYDGADYNQTDFSAYNKNRNSSLKEYTDEYQISNLIAESMLEKPQDTTKLLLEIIGLVAITIIALTAYFSASKLYNSTQLNYKILNTTLQVIKIQNMRDANMSAQQINLTKALISYLNAPKGLV